MAGLCSNTLRRAVASRIIPSLAIHLDQHAKIDVSPEGPLDGFQV